MAGGVESWSSSSAEGEAKLEMVMEFSLDDGGVAAASFSSSPKLPRRLRRRLSESKTPQKCTVQDIEAKLRHAYLRRQVRNVAAILKHREPDLPWQWHSVNPHAVSGRFGSGVWIQCSSVV
ncbi:t-complex protein 11-like protein 1 [Fagus crenata]